MNFNLCINNNSNSFFSIINGKKQVPISLCEKAGVDEINVMGKEIIQHTPNKKKERDVLFIAGQSGSGKSYYVMQYAKEYQKMYPKREIILFSSLSDDSGSIDKIKGLKKIKINNPAFIECDIPIEEFKNCMLIFDDVDSISNKAIKKHLWNIMNNCLTMGRHHNITMVITFHVLTNGAETKIILNESNSITIFPSASGNRSLKYLLDSYLGLSKKEIELIKKLDSRHITVLKTYPKMLISEKKAMILRPN
jgi:hypothetical protein